MTDCSTFHLNAHRVVFFHDFILYFGGFDELITACNLADKAAGGTMVDCFKCFNSGFDHQVACADGINIWRIVTQEACIVVVVAQLSGNHNVQNLEVMVDCAGNSGIDDALCAEAVDHHLCGDCCVYLTDTAGGNDNFLIAQDSFPEYLTAYIDFADILHLLF